MFSVSIPLYLAYSLFSSSTSFLRIIGKQWCPQWGEQRWFMVSGICTQLTREWLCLRSETLIFFNPSGILNYIDQEIRIFLIICYAVSVTGIKGFKRFVLVISIIAFLTPLDLIVKSMWHCRFEMQDKFVEHALMEQRSVLMILCIKQVFQWM